MNFPTNKCCGIFGKWFGHKYVTYVVESDCHHNIENIRAIGVSDMERLLSAISMKKCKIVCKRCGKQIEGR